MKFLIATLFLFSATSFGLSQKIYLNETVEVSALENCSCDYKDEKGRISHTASGIKCSSAKHSLAEGVRVVLNEVSMFCPINPELSVFRRFGGTEVTYTYYEYVFIDNQGELEIGYSAGY